MAKLEIELTPDEETRLTRQAEGARLPLADWARRRLHDSIPTLPVTFTTDDGEVYEIPDLPTDLGRATALASEQTLKRLWETPEEDAAWRSS